MSRARFTLKYILERVGGVMNFFADNRVEARSFPVTKRFYVEMFVV